MPVGLDEDVVLVGVGQRLGSGEVGVHRQVLEEWVPLGPFQVAGQQCRLAAGIDYETAFPVAGHSIGVGERYSDSFIIIEDNLGNPVAL